jgi:hypothetical protein
MNSYTDHSKSFDRHPNGLNPLAGRVEYITVYHPRQLQPLLKRVMDSIAHWLTSGSMPRISKATQGETEVWRVYDPVSSRTLYFDQEDALRIWMEERYYQ